MTHPHPKRSFVPQAVLTRTDKINTAGANVNTAGASINNVIRPINTAASTLIVNHPGPKSNAFKKGYSQSLRPFNRYYANKNSIVNTNVNTVRVKNTTVRDRAVVSENKGNGLMLIRPQHAGFGKPKIGNPQQKEYKEKAVIDSGCSRYMTGNKSYLDEYEDYDGGFVSFGDGKGRIFGKGKIKTGSLDFDDVYFCKELKYNLFSVSQICDKKNNVLFTNTKCLVLSSNFKLLDKSQVLLRVPRKDNIYSVDLKSVVTTRGLTCLIANATIDESNTWHKLVKGNVLKGQDQKEKDLEQEYILIPLYTTDPLSSQGPKDSEGDAGMKPIEVDERGDSNKNEKEAQDTRSKSERLNQREIQTEHTNSTNNINTVSILVNIAGPSFANVVPSPPVDTTRPSDSTDNVFEEDLFERFSPFKNAFTLPPVPNVSSMDNIGIF
ncbi:hypothetical protein Tco_0537679, partial [Tanacetum coccineum]